MLRPLFLLIVSCFFLGLSAQDVGCSFGLVLTSAEASVGEEVTIDVTTRQYNDIVALQYAHRWNPAKLRFVEVLYNPAITITAGNFNLTPEMLNQGILNFAYVEPTGLGLTLTEETPLYQLRFELLDTEGAQVTTSDLSGTIEIINSEQDILGNFYFLHAEVGAAAVNPSFFAACINGQACDNPDLGRIAIEAIPQAGELLAEWTNTDGFSASGNEITGLNSGSYQLTLTDEDGNSTEGDFYVSSDSGLELNLSVDADVCGGTPDGRVITAITRGSDNYSYSWSNGATTANLLDVPAGVYSVTITDLDLGCSISASATVSSTSQILGFFQTTTASCATVDDGSLTINVEGPTEAFPVAYLWSTGATTAEITDLSAGAYTVTVTDAGGCESVFTTVLAAETLEFSAEVVPASCQAAGGAISILLSGEQYSFLWDNGATTSSITDLPNGTYTVTVTDETTGCSASETYVLATDELVTGVAYDCFEVDGEQVSDITVAIWNPNDGPYTFTWSNGVTETTESISTITAPALGNYSLTITSANGCETILTDLVPFCGEDAVEFYLSPATSALANGEDRCFAVQVNNFNAVGSAQFSLSWDETKLGFQELTNLSISGLTPSNFNTNLTSDGILAFSWLTTDLVNGETLANGGTLFELCLQANSAEETTTLIEFTNFPTPLEVTDIQPQILASSTEPATVMLNGGTTGNGQTGLVIGNTTVTQGEQFCVPFTANAFADIIGLQASIAWDPAALQFTGVESFNLPFLSDVSFNAFAEAQLDGALRVVWAANDLIGANRSDGAALFELCFIASGEVGDYPVTFVEDPLPLQLVSADFTEISATTDNGLVAISSQADDEVRLRIGSTAVEPGEVACVPIEAQAFNDIVAMQFSINWDNNLIRFEELNLLDNELELNQTNFNVLENEGKLNLAWVANILEPVTLTEGTPLFELCYTAQAQEGPAGIIFSSQPTAIEFVRDNTVVPFVPTNGTITVTSDNLVWPGDTNEDGIANHFDVLPLGLGFEATGASRTNPSINWLPQYAAPWPGSTPTSAINFRHADTDGDGSITIADTAALSLNWGLTVDEFGGGDVPQSFLTGAPLYVQADTIMAGVAARLPIMLGTEELLEDAYGIAFTLRYDPETVEAGSIHIAADGWLTAGESASIMLYRDFPSDGRTEIAMVRTDGQGVAGAGQIAELVIIMEDVILRNLIDVETYFRIEGVELITPNETVLPTSPRETTVLVEGVTSTSAPEWANLLQLSPNPTPGIVRLNASGLNVRNLQLIDAAGRLVMEKSTNLQQLDLTALPAGMYQLRVATDLGVVYEKLMKQ